MRQRAAASDVVIVNHHLLCADASVRQSAYGEVIPAFTRVILDEAHQLEDIATQYFGFAVSNYRVEELARDVERLAVDDRKAKDEIAVSLCLAMPRGPGRLERRASGDNSGPILHRRDAPRREDLARQADSERALQHRGSGLDLPGHTEAELARSGVARGRATVGRS